MFSSPAIPGIAQFLFPEGEQNVKDREEIVNQVHENTWKREKKNMANYVAKF